MSIKSDNINQCSFQIESKDDFDKLFRYYYPRLIAYVSSLLEESAAEDIVQDVFLYVWENRAKIYIGNGFISFLFQAGYTRAIDQIRKERTVSNYSNNVQTTILDIHESIMKTDEGILEQLYSKDFDDTLYSLLEQIPDQRREIFLLAYIEGLKSKEIAEKFCMSQRTVESHIYLTLKFLREHLLKKDFLFLFTLFAFSLK